MSSSTTTVLSRGPLVSVFREVPGPRGRTRGAPRPVHDPVPDRGGVLAGRRSLTAIRERATGLPHRRAGGPGPTGGAGAGASSSVGPGPVHGRCADPKTGGGQVRQRFRPAEPARALRSPFNGLCRPLPLEGLTLMTVSEDDDRARADGRDVVAQVRRSGALDGLLEQVRCRTGDDDRG